MDGDVDVRWYIQNEVVSGAYGSGNKFGIERIRRFKACRKELVAELMFSRNAFSQRKLFCFIALHQRKKGWNLEQQLVFFERGVAANFISPKKRCWLFGFLVSHFSSFFSILQVQVKATQTLINIQMNFGVRVAFDYGNCTGPDCKFDWEQLDQKTLIQSNSSGVSFPGGTGHYLGQIVWSICRHSVKISG